MINKILLTGKIGIGKSTIIKNVLRLVNSNVGGYIEKKLLMNDVEMIKIQSLIDENNEGIIARRNIKDKKIIGYIDVFDKIGVEILSKSLQCSDIIIMDEIGFLEEKAELFKNKIIEVLDSDKFVLGVIKDFDKKSEFLDAIRSREDIQIIRIDEGNRNEYCLKLQKYCNLFL